MCIRNHVQIQLGEHKTITEEDVQRVISLNTGETEEEIRKRYPLGEQGVYAIVEHPTSGLFPKLEVVRVLTNEFDEFDEKYEFIHVGESDEKRIPYFRSKS